MILPSYSRLIAFGRVSSRLQTPCLAFLSRTFFTLPSFSSGPESGVQTYKVSKRVNVTPEQMFNVVSDVSKYHEFVPFVEKSLITKKDKLELPLEGVLRVGWQQFDEEFTSKINCVPNEKVTVKSLTILLFNSLHTEWSFKEIKSSHIREPSCEVELNLKYSFKNPLYNAVSSMFSDQVTKIMIKAFEQRAIESKLKNKFKTRDVKFNKN
mmetsp:Transcript_6618/g.8340  ORF Transcript_6618/g.8340 Transcript_6618/m.8340 type:complete len:210 (+) Transcript_6618:7797-8426(+)